MTRPFDGEVKVGELRIFADLARPVVALIAEDRGAFGFRIIPVSDFTNVSCEGEKIIGDRVYQFWNTCNVPRSFAVRSWLVATLPHSEFSLIHSSTSTSHFNYSPYQRTYLFSVPSPFASFENESSHRTFSPFTFTFSFRRVAGFALAACFVFALVFAVRLDLDRASHKEERAHAWNIVMAPPEPEKLRDVHDEAAESESIEVAANAPNLEIAPPANAQFEREPEIGAKVTAPKLMKAKSVARSAEAPAVDRYDAAVMRALGRKTTDDHAIAVMTYLACGVGTGESEFGAKFVESIEKLVASVREAKTSEEYTRRLVATALCRAYVATSNPDLMASAESALDSLGDKRSVEIVARGYDLIEDWFASQQKQTPSSSVSVAAPQTAYPDWFRFLKSRVK